jgi:hypothetical protein
LQEIDSQLRSSTPPFNGFDGLCGNLGLPVRRSNLASSFQLSAELPAEVLSVVFSSSKRALVIEIDCFGAPDLMVEWLPQHEFHKVPAGWLYEQHPDDFLNIYVEIGVPSRPPSAADLILSFGEQLSADVITVDLPPLTFQDEVVGGLELEFEREEPAVPDLGTREAPSQQEPSNIATREAPNQKDGGRKGSADPEVAIRRTIVKQNSKLKTLGMCWLFDNKKVPLPPGSDWEDFRSHDRPWTAAYRKGGNKLRRRIRVIIAKDKNA